MSKKSTMPQPISESHQALISDLLFKQNLVAVFEFDRDLKMVRFNSLFVEHLNSTPALLTGLDLKKLYDQSILPHFQKILQGESTFYEGEYQCTTSTSNLRGRLELFPTFDQNGKVKGGIGICLATPLETKMQTDRKVVDQMVREILRSVSVGAAVISPDGKLILSNALFEQITGYRQRELMNLDLSVLVHPDYQNLVRETFTLFLAGKSPKSNIDVKIMTKNKTEKWLNCGFNTITYHDKINILMTAADITEHRWMEEELNIQKSFFENLFNASPDAIAVLDTDDRILQINARFTELFGYTSQEAVGNFINDLVVPSHLKEEGVSITQKVASGNYVSVETVRQKKDGKLIDVTIIGRPIYLGNNQVAVYGIYQDISNRKKLEKIRTALFEINNAVHVTRNLDDLFCQVHDILKGIINVDNFFIALVDPYHREIYFPYACDEVDKDYPDIRISLDDRKSLTVEVIEAKKPLLLTQRMLAARFADQDEKKYGTLPVSWLGIPLLLNNETIGAIVVQSYTKPDLYTAEDAQILESIAGQIALAIERKLADVALRESEEKYRLLVETSQDGIVISQHDQFIFVNKAFAEMLGYTVEELRDKDYRAIYTERGLAILYERGRRRKRGEQVPSRYETVFKKKDGSELDVEANVTIIDYKGEKATFAIIRDISERKKLLAALMESAEKTRALGDLIPICASCKKIRDESKPDKPWVDPEVYITERLKDINFSHGICPTCMKKLYPDFARKHDTK